MSLRTRVPSDAATELGEAVRWYDSEASGLGDGLVERGGAGVDRRHTPPNLGSPQAPDGGTGRAGDQLGGHFSTGLPVETQRIGGDGGGGVGQG